MTTPELKPCPFCGGKAEPRGKYAECSGNRKCPLNGYGILVAAWNTRPIESALEAQRDRLLTACKAGLFALDMLDVFDSIYGIGNKHNDTIESREAIHRSMHVLRHIIAAVEGGAA